MITKRKAKAAERKRKKEARRWQRQLEGHKQQKGKHKIGYGGYEPEAPRPLLHETIIPTLLLGLLP